MRYARGPGPDPQLVEAERGRTGTCPGCGSALVAKCGTIVSPHWAHHARPDCDDWSEPESEWHLAWKRHAPPERTEVVMGANREHRADVVLPNGYVLELQHSALSAEAIREREEFYTREAGGMCWLWDASRFWASVVADGPYLILPRHRVMYVPQCTMYWDVPPHPTCSPERDAAAEVASRLQDQRDCVKTWLRCEEEFVRKAAALGRREEKTRSAEQAYRDNEARARAGDWLAVHVKRHKLELACDSASRAEEKAFRGREQARDDVRRCEFAYTTLGRSLDTACRLALLQTAAADGGVLRVAPTLTGAHAASGAFRVEEFLTRDQFASVIRGAQ